MDNPSTGKTTTVGDFTVYKITVGEAADTMEKLTNLPLILAGTDKLDKATLSKAISKSLSEVILVCAAFTRQKPEVIRQIEDLDIFMDVLFAGFELNRFLAQLNGMGERIEGLVGTTG